MVRNLLIYIYPSQDISPETPSFFVESPPHQMWLNLALTPRRSLSTVKYEILEVDFVSRKKRCLAGAKFWSKCSLNLSVTSLYCGHLRQLVSNDERG